MFFDFKIKVKLLKKEEKLNRFKVGKYRYTETKTMKRTSTIFKRKRISVCKCM